MLWALTDVGRLDPVARAAIVPGPNDVVVSVASVWEVAIKRAAGKLTIDGSLMEGVERTGFRLLSIEAAHAERAGALPAYHRDPFDRMLVAQALVEGLTLVTRDPLIGRYGVPTLQA